MAVLPFGCGIEYRVHDGRWGCLKCDVSWGTDPKHCQRLANPAPLPDITNKLVAYHLSLAARLYEDRKQTETTDDIVAAVKDEFAAADIALPACLAFVETLEAAYRKIGD